MTDIDQLEESELIAAFARAMGYEAQITLGRNGTRVYEQGHSG
jgi:hypothetical protein